MKKVSLIAPSILNTLGFLIFSIFAEASTAIKKDDADLIPQLQPLSKDFCEDEHLLTTYKNEVINKPFDREACNQAIFQKQGELFSCEFSREDKFAIMLDLEKLYYEFGKHCEGIDKKEAYYEEAEFYFGKSQLPEAETYLAEINEYLQN